MPDALTPLEKAVFDAHKRAHGLTPEHKHWDDERWEEGGAWYFDPRAFLTVLGIEETHPEDTWDPLYRIKAVET